MLKKRIVFDILNVNKGGEIMNLFIIGNGFDLAHGLQTQYINFREYLDEQDWRFLMTLEETYGFCSDSDLKLLEKHLWKDFENNLSNINETEIIELGTHIELGLEGGDFDIEETLDTYWEEQYGYIKRLNNYLNSWISQINIGVCKKTDIINEENNDLFINFNYTLLLEEIYNIDSYDVLHVHGSVDSHDVNPIIGHGDYDKVREMKKKSLECANKRMEKETSIYNAVHNYYDRTFKDVQHYIDWNENFFNRLNTISEIFVVGHSLGKVDLPYFEKVLSIVPSNACWNVFFHNNEDEDNFAETLVGIGVNPNNIKTFHTSKFFNM